MTCTGAERSFRMESSGRERKGAFGRLAWTSLARRYIWPKAS